MKWWQHQVAEFNWMLERECGILNAGMGTGKTFVTLAYLDRKKFTRTLIVATGKGVDVWKEEIDDKLVKRPVVVDDNGLSVKLQAKQLSDLQGSYIYLTTYARLWREPLLSALISAQFDCVILDESHKIATNNSKVSKGAAKIGKSSSHRFGLTGTLLTNNPLNIFGQARFINPKMFNSPETPNLLNSFNRFREHFCHLKPIPGVLGAYFITGYKNMEFYESVLNKYVYRVDSDEVLDLPEAIHKVVTVQMPSKLKPIYKAISKDGFVRIEDRVVVADNVLVVGIRLHQIAGGFITTSDPNGNPKDTITAPVHREKLDALAELVENLDETEPVIVFAKYTEEIFNIAETLKELGTVSVLSGQRDELKEWQDGKTRFMVVQTETGSESIDLSRAKYTFIYSVGWSLANYEQMLRRMRRPRKDGSRAETVFYYHLVMSGTIDMDIHTALRDKKEITNSVLERITGYRND